MTVTLDRPRNPEDLDHKAAPGGQALGVDDAQGEVTAIVSVTGVVDEVNDVLLPGCYSETLTKRRPKVVWSHSWDQPIGRVVEIEEYRPGDRRLPQRTKDGKPWPREAGALVARMQFNMASERGREAYHAVKFYSESDEAEYSIGYQVPPGKATRDKNGVRKVAAVDLYELSPVLFGAAPLSMTLAMKDAHGAEQPADGEDEDALHAAVPAAGLDGESQVPADVLAGLPSSPPGSEWDDDLAADDADMPVQAVDEQALVGKGLYAAEVKRKFSTDKRRDLAKRGIAMADGSFPIESEQDLRNAIRAVGRTDESKRPKVKAHIRKRARALGKTDLIPDSWGSDSKATLVRHPLGHVERWWEVEGKAGTPGVADTPSDQAAVRRLIRWYERGEGAARIRWGTDGSFMRCVRLAGKHMDPERAKGFCANRYKGATGRWPGQRKALRDELGLGDPLPPVAVYDPAAEVGPYAGHLPADTKHAPAAEPALWGEQEVEAKAWPFLPGSDEERRHLVYEAAEDALGGERTDDGREWPMVEVLATYPDRAIIRRWAHSGPHQGQEETYSVTYTLRDGEAILGEPEQVRLEVNANVEPVDQGLDAAEQPPIYLLDALGLLTRSVDAAHMQTKAGRVLSGANEKRLRAAVESLIAVLRAAGVRINEEAGKDEAAQQPTGDEPDPNTAEGRRDTTAPTARGATADGQAKVAVDPAEYARALDVRRFLAQRRQQ